MSNEPFVKIEDVSKVFNPSLPPALDHISANINKGEMLGLAGPDGAGKTTLIRLIATLMVPTSGKILVDGLDTVTEAYQISSLIGYMPQKFGLYEDLTVIQNLNLYADLKGLDPKDRKDVYDQLLEFTNLKPFIDRFAKNLSGGMKQKLGLACALLSKPKLLLLDEPSVGVDPLSRRELWKMVQELLSEDISVVWSTSYLDEAEKCASVILLNEGHMLYHGSPDGLTEKVKGRVFGVCSKGQARRQLLTEILSEKNVEDGIIQADNIRVVVKEEKNPPFKLPRENLQIKPLKPRFEDAFVDLLGGGPGGYSALAETTPEIHGDTEEIVVANHLTKKFGDFTAASDITFKVKRGEIFGLLGPNGAGKTTTFKMLCGLLTPTSGSAEVDGYDLQKSTSIARSKIGYMAQKFSLYGNLTVEQNLDFFAGLYSLVGEEQKKRIGQMVDLFNMKPYLEELTDLLPLGFKQRLALSCSVMHRPQVLFLDEPTSGVDPITRREFWTHINGLVNKGVTVIVTTHFMEEAEYCDRIALVYKSKIIKMGTPTELKKEAATKDNPEPTMEDAFITLIEREDGNGV